ncbi:MULTISPECIES: hypothetical protein [Paenibacillus]|uniref:hypothetical protein n=1 Tax=Paenibacillus TaxID=44249 RepID=UPI00096C26AB|nr:hypothetical protein [Paenibacillus odorifer]OMD48472.1 hypothetical protein BSK55_29155 [Paenibacillus odorifer]OME48740.1 hypothetical protein BSK61_24485 [Paenibacillus odorifer]
MKKIQSNSKTQLRNNLKRLKQLDEEQQCLFKEIKINCRVSTENKKTINSHVISEKDYLSRISEEKFVIVCDHKSEQYYAKTEDNQLSEMKKSFKKVKVANVANTRNLLCGDHDKILFNRIENGRHFDITNSDYQEQCFQFALRAFLFGYIHSKRLDDPEIQTGHSKTANSIYEQRKDEKEQVLEKFKRAYLQEKWDVLHTEVYTLPKEIQFISSVSFFPYSYMKYKYGGHIKENIFLNVFPDGNNTKIVIAYFKDNSKHSKVIVEKISAWYKKGYYKKIEQFLTRCILLYDLNVTYRPSFYEKLLSNDDSAKQFFELSFLIRTARGMRFMFDYPYSVLIKRLRINIFEGYK